nr:protein NUCLEAR FUSION DEFECTIVE 6, chloroplastic/mitochondrial-like isoform X2 [Ipomoea batatas]
MLKIFLSVATGGCSIIIVRHLQPLRNKPLTNNSPEEGSTLAACHQGRFGNRRSEEAETCDLRPARNHGQHHRQVRLSLRRNLRPDRRNQTGNWSELKPKTSVSPFHIPTQKPLTARIFRFPLELSCVRVETMLPYHTATACALLNSMLSVAPRSRCWSLEDG